MQQYYFRGDLSFVASYNNELTTTIYNLRNHNQSTYYNMQLEYSVLAGADKTKR